MKNKRGSVMNIIVLFLVLFTILILGFVGAMVVGVIDFASDTITPVMKDIGIAGDSNISQYAEYGFGTADKTVQAFPWVLAFGYMMALIFTLVFIVVTRTSTNKAFIGLYLVMMVLLIFGCIIMSNMYQDIYTGNDEISTRLQEQTITSYLILHSPFIMCMIAVIGGVLMFTLSPREEGGYI